VRSVRIHFIYLLWFNKVWYELPPKQLRPMCISKQKTKKINTVISFGPRCFTFRYIQVTFSTFGYKRIYFRLRVQTRPIKAAKISFTSVPKYHRQPNALVKLTIWGRHS